MSAEAGKGEEVDQVFRFVGESVPPPKGDSDGEDLPGNEPLEEVDLSRPVYPARAGGLPSCISQAPWIAWSNMTPIETPAAFPKSGDK